MLSGAVQHYISNCIVGGRCMTSNNKMYHVKRKLAYFDACSLHPSAMNRMKGYLKGTPKVLNTSQLSYSFISSQDGYFIRVRFYGLVNSDSFLYCLNILKAVLECLVMTLLVMTQQPWKML